MRNSKSHQDELAGLHTNVQRQIYVTRLVKQAKVDPINLPRNKKNKLLLNFDELLNKLNSSLLSMYLMKGNLQISNSDIIQIQSTDEHLDNIRKKISQNDENMNSKFCLIREVLFKKSLVFNEIVYRLCLPRYLGREILLKLHARLQKKFKITLSRNYERQKE